MAIIAARGLASGWSRTSSRTRRSFFPAFLTGLNNGALYALIALGYTMVYGIIELINFAHGDLFMLGTIIAANVMVNWLGLHSHRLAGLLGSAALTMVIVMIVRARSSTSAPSSSPTGGCGTRPSWRR